MDDISILLLKYLIIGGGVILGTVIGYSIFLYPHIPIQWKIAITTFILLLPFSFLLQVFLNVKSFKDSRILEIQGRFRERYKRFVRFLGKEKAPSITEQDLNDDLRFKHMFEERCNYLLHEHDGQLYSIYQEAYQIYLTDEQKWEKLGKKNVIREGLIKFEFREFLNIIVEQEMLTKGIDFHSYLLPLSFFMFIYFAGFLITLPLINSIFTGNAQTTFIPLFNTNKYIPMLVIQWGFLGGLVYTSISLLYRFLRKDLVPRVYFNSSFRLLLSSVVAVIIYFLYMFKEFVTAPSSPSEVPPQVLLACFVAGVAPIQFLINFADTQLSKMYRWKRRSIAGKSPVTLLEGINSITAERLSEEGIDSIQQMAFSNYQEISELTKFPRNIVADWREQAILYLLTGDVVLPDFSFVGNKNDAKQNKTVKENEYLNDMLDKKLGIRTISAFIDTWGKIKEDSKIAEQKSLIRGLGFVDDDEGAFDLLKHLFMNIYEQGIRFGDKDSVKLLEDYKNEEKINDLR